MTWLVLESQGVLEKTHEAIDLLVKCTWGGTSGVLQAEQNSVGGALTEKGWEPLTYCKIATTVGDHQTFSSNFGKLGPCQLRSNCI